MRGGSVLWRGMRLSDLTNSSRERLRVASTASGVVVIDVLENSPAAAAHIQIGDVVEQVGGEAVKDVGEFRRRVQAAAGAVELRLRSAGNKTILP